jgi:hypothetical protein
VTRREAEAALARETPNADAASIGGGAPALPLLAGALRDRPVFDAVWTWPYVFVGRRPDGAPLRCTVDLQDSATPAVWAPEVSRQFAVLARASLEVDESALGGRALGRPDAPIEVALVPQPLELHFPDGTVRRLRPGPARTFGEWTFPEQAYAFFDSGGRAIDPATDVGGWGGQVFLRIVYRFDCDCLDRPVERAPLADALLGDIVAEVIGRHSAGCTATCAGAVCDLAAPISEVPFRKGASITVTNQFRIAFRAGGGPTVRIALSPRARVRDVPPESFAALRGDLAFRLGGEELAPDDLLYVRCAEDDVVDVAEAAFRTCEFVFCDGERRVQRQVPLTETVAEVARALQDGGQQLELFIERPEEVLPAERRFVECVPRGAVARVARRITIEQVVAALRREFAEERANRARVEARLEDFERRVMARLDDLERRVAECERRGT